MRPKKDKQSLRKNAMWIYLTDAEKRELVGQAEYQGLDQTKVIYQALHEYFDRKRKERMENDDNFRK